MINFISVHYPNPQFPNKWRNILTIVLFVLGVGGGLGYIYRSNVVHVWGEVQNQVKGIKLTEESNTVGGDLIFEPVIIPQPHRSASSTDLDSSVFSAASIMVKDRESGVILYEKNGYEPHSLASITKLMSALTLLELKPDWTTSTVVVGADSLDAHMYAGDMYTCEELWGAALVGSSNKAVLSLINALHTTEEVFVARMNQKAQEIGMSQTHFVDPTGILDGNISTASDAVLLLNEALSHDEIRNTLLVSEYDLYSAERKKSHHMWNTNWLLLGWIPNTFDGGTIGKTGYIPASLYNVVLEITQGGHAIDVVVFGAKSNEARFTEARDVAEWVFENYVWD